MITIVLATPIETAFAAIASGDRILVLKRSPGSGSPGTWGFPGGHLEKKETAKKAVLRECLEEIGVKPPGTLVRTVKIRKDDINSAVMLFHSGEFVRDSVKIVLNDEHTKYKWVTLAWLLRNRQRLHYSVKLFLKKKATMVVLDRLFGEDHE